MAQTSRNQQFVDAEYLKQVAGAHRDFRNLFSNNMQMAPTILRLAFHDAGTYDAKSNTGGVNGSIRNEMSTPPNVGMQPALDFCEQVKVKNPKISYADLYQIGGVTAVEITGGPIIPFVPGRKDAPPQIDSGSIPSPGGDSQHLRDVFHRMGLTDKDIVVLSGAHTLGRAHKDKIGVDGPFTRDPLTFDNTYYSLLLQGDVPDLIKFNTDKSLVNDPVFGPLVQKYSQDQNAFFKDYVISHKKMSELGFNPMKQDSHPNQKPTPHPHPNPNPNSHPHNTHKPNQHNQHNQHKHEHHSAPSQHGHHHSPPSQHVQHHCPQQQHRPQQCRPHPSCGYQA